MPPQDVVLVRNALEQWDEPAGNRLMAERGADPAGHSWRKSGEGLLAGVINDAVLRAWAAAVHKELFDWWPR